MANGDEPVSGESEDSEDSVFGKDDVEPRPPPRPQNQTLKHKVIYYADRVFLCFLALLLLVLTMEVLYKIWYITNWSAIVRHLKQLAQWLSAPEEDEPEL